MTVEVPSTLPKAGSDDVLYVLDLSSFVFRAYHAMPPLSAPNGEPTNATLGTMNMFHRILAQQRPKNIAIAMDSRGRGFRGELDANYKANRPPTPSDLVVQLQRCRELFEAYGIPVFQRDGFEADDLIASVVKHARKVGLRVVIASSDKDLFQLVDGTDVLVWDAARDKVYGPREVQEKFGVEPSRVRDFLALVGDTSDNVAGIPGVGPKTAALLIQKFGSLAEVLANAAAIDKPKLRDSVLAHSAQAELAYRLVELRDNVDIQVDSAALRFENADVASLRRIFSELQFSRLLEGLDGLAAHQTAEKAPISVPGLPVPTVSGTAILDAAALAQFVSEARARNGFAVMAFGLETNAVRTPLIGLAVAATEGRPFYIPLGHRTLTAPKQLSLAALVEGLGPLLNEPKIRKFGHDLKFTQVLLARHGLPIQGAAFDSMLASYLLDPEAGHRLEVLAAREAAYTVVVLEDKATGGPRQPKHGLDMLEVESVLGHACSHVTAILRLAHRLGPKLAEAGVANLLEKLELPLADVLVEMERSGVALNAEPLAVLGNELTLELAELETKAYAAAGRPLNLASPKQLETVLFDELKLHSTRKTKTGRSTDAEALEAIADAHPLPQLILEHRTIAKLKGTYVDTLPGIIDAKTGRIHTHWDQAAAATGRISSREPNLQNIPVRTAHGKRIREAFTAPPGKLILSADYSQIELRVLAHLSHDPVLVEAFSTDQDVHVRTAMEVFGVSKEAVTHAMRAQSKTVNFGVIYGMGSLALGKRLGIPRAEAKRFIEAYFERYRGVEDYLRLTLEEARETGEVRTLLGRRRLLPDLRSSNPMKRAYAERSAQNTPIQGTAADLLKLAMVGLLKPVFPEVRMVLTVHDELVFEVPEARIEEAARLIKSAMESVATLDVPLVVDVGWGKNWADAKA